MQEEADKIRLKESAIIIESADDQSSPTSSSESAPISSSEDVSCDVPASSSGGESEVTSSVTVPALPADPDLIGMDDVAGLESGWLPIGKQLEINIPMPPQRFKVLLESLCFNRAKDGRLDSTKPLSGQVEDDSFEFYRRADFWRSPFQPSIEGRYQSHGGMTRVRILTKLRPGTKRLLGSAPAAIVGASLAAVASAYMLPNVVALTYSFIGTILGPIIATIVCFFIARSVVPSDLRYMLNLIRKSCNQPENYQPVHAKWPDLKQKRFLSDEVQAAAIAVVVYLAAAVSTHWVAWNYWCDGKYEESARLCLPGVQLTQVVLGPTSGAVADARYYLAECYRCMGRYDEAEKLYKQALTVMQNTLGRDHVFVADVQFNLGRVFEHQSRLDEAVGHYLEAAKIWSKSTGEDNQIVSRTYDRIAIALMKQGKTDDAISYLNKALTIDRKYGSNAGRSVQEDLNDLGLLMIKKGDLRQAEALLQESLQAKQATAGENGFSLVSTLLNLSSVYESTGRQKLALTLKQRARTILDRHMKRLGLATNSDIYKDVGLVFQHHQNQYEPPNIDTRSNGTGTGASIDGRL